MRANRWASFGVILRVAIGVVVLIAMADAKPALGSWAAIPPALPAPSGRVVSVSTEPELQGAIASLTSGTTVLIAPGTYVLTRTLYVKGPLADVAIRGSSDSRDDVVLQGPGMTNPNYGAVEFGIWVGGDVQRLTLANMTIRDVYFHPIIMNAGPQSPRLYNLHLINGGQQLLKTNPDDYGRGINNGIIEYSVFEYSPESRDWYANAIQVLGGANWIIRNNLIKNIKAPSGQQAGPAVLAWLKASGTVVEGNTFINCQREISFGLVENTPNDHTGGIIRNNFIYRDDTVENGDVAIGVFDSPGTKVLHNTILVGGTYPNAIEYRFPKATDILIANNLINKAITAREGATATVTGNYTSATASMFVNAAEGNLHLVPTATAAIDRASVMPEITVDWDDQPRSAGGMPDLGADEFVAGAQRPATPKNVRIIK
jgi:hypothetical protein